MEHGNHLRMVEPVLDFTRDDSLVRIVRHDMKIFVRNLFARFDSFLFWVDGSRDGDYSGPVVMRFLRSLECVGRQY